MHQPPGDNGSRITNYLLEWDEVRVTLMLLFNLLSPFNPPPHTHTLTPSGGSFLRAGEEEQRLQRMLLWEPETL